MAANEMQKKYDTIADSYSNRYVNPQMIARRQADLVQSWGYRPGPNAEVLEIGCADGLITAELAQRGFSVTALDLSPRMIEVTRRRLVALNLSAGLHAVDIEEFEPHKEWDVTIAMMGSFFTYVEEPQKTLGVLAQWTRKKLLVDLNPRRVDLSHALDAVRAAGFDSVTWRPFFVPTGVPIGKIQERILRAMEVIPVVRDLVLKKKFKVVIRGEKSGH
ncbi:MAG TPA: class I SAM-dependent methyltransferase [Actinomycetota bacterium]|nr:class I SAM-dependent methyltransferase [Actinomycetota bacterium]